MFLRNEQYICINGTFEKDNQLILVEVKVKKIEERPLYHECNSKLILCRIESALYRGKWYQIRLSKTLKRSIHVASHSIQFTQLNKLRLNQI